MEQPRSIYIIFNQLRFDMYQSRKTPYVKLPPSSHSLQGHLQRCFFIIRMAMNVDPLEFRWTEVDGYTVPNKQLLLLPNFYLVHYGCIKKCTGHCSWPNRMLLAQNFVNAKESVPISLDTLLQIFLTLFRSLVIYTKFN